MIGASVFVPVLVALAVAVAGARWAAAVPPPTVNGSTGPGPLRRLPSPRLMGAAGALIGAATIGPFPVAALVGLMIIGRRVAARRASRRTVAHRDAAVPDLVDLFVIAAAAGHTAHGCIHAVAPRAPEPVKPFMDRASRRIGGGDSIQTVLRDAGAELGPLAEPLVGALAAGAATGAPMTVGLSQVAEAAREARRRRSEEQARRLPVTMIFPLVLCILPAFLLLAVVPLLVGSLGSLQP